MADTSALNKAELCAALGWGRPKLDRVLDREPNFPVRTRGDSKEGWTFNLPTVMSYLAAGGAKPGKAGRKPQRKEDEAPEEPVAPAPVAHQGEATAKQRRDQASAQLLEDKLRRDRGELLERDDVRQTMAEALATFSRHLDGLPDQLVSLLALDEAKTERIRETMNELRRQLVTDLSKLLG